VLGEDLGSFFVAEPLVFAMGGLDDFTEVVVWTSCDEDGGAIIPQQALLVHACGGV